MVKQKQHSIAFNTADIPTASKVAEVKLSWETQEIIVKMMKTAAKHEMITISVLLSHKMSGQA